ncbi:MAG TPA: diaminopimelate decarboxylase [Armatimonadota bacterium]|jgi:diaminopimelate decarboxylase
MLFGTQRINDKGHLEIGGCDTIDLAKQFGTPLYVMDEALVRQNCREYIHGFKTRYQNTEIAFAGKAFLNIAACRIMAQEGMCLDVASGGELYTAMKANFPMERVYFHGSFKLEAELRMAIERGVGRIVVDSLEELDLLNSVAQDMGTKADILLRVTPGIDPHTHKRISTGQADTKFGLNIQNGTAMVGIKKAVALPNIALRGIHCHVGSQLLDFEAHIAAIRIMVELAKDIKDQTGLAVEEINTGGGLGIRYVESQQAPTIDHFAEIITSTFISALEEFGVSHNPRLVQEAGRSIAGTAGTTLYTVGPIKKVPIAENPGYRIYVSVDGGLSDNPRPTLYDAIYEVVAANKANAPKSETVTVSGRHCETDTLIVDTRVPELQTGDILAVQCTGAYNYAMASNYNRFCKPAVVVVQNGSAEVIVERETYDDLVRHDIVTPRLNG